MANKQADSSAFFELKFRKHVSVGLHPLNDADIIAKIEERKSNGESPIDYVRRLIRDNIRHGDYWDPKE